MADQEGVVKFRLEHRGAPLVAREVGALACKLISWREILSLTKLVGADPQRYEGFGYGNVSGRVGPPSAPLGRRSFLITGTQTSGRRAIGLDAFALVERYDYRENRVESRGETEPSSEAMTHAAIYDLGPHIRCVMHAHSPILWRHGKSLRLPVTDPSAAYGTTEIALAVHDLWRHTGLPDDRVLVMGGHEDGVVAFGRSPEETGRTLLTWLARAYELECRGLDPGLRSR